MAGTSKPNVEKLGKEMTDYEIVTYRSHNSCNPIYLFDGIEAPSNWRHSFDWNYNGDYCTITFNKKCNIWRKTLPNNGHNNSLNITPNTYKTQHTLKNPNNSGDYELWLEGLEPGTYTFSHTGKYRGDIEWYLEEVQTESKMIKENVKDAILNHELIQKHVMPFETIEEESTSTKSRIYNTVYEAATAALE